MRSPRAQRGPHVLRSPTATKSAEPRLSSLSDGDSEYTQSDEGGEDELEELGLHDDPSDSTDEEVEDRPPSDSGRDDLDQQGAVQFECVAFCDISEAIDKG